MGEAFESIWGWAAAVAGAIAASLVIAKVAAAREAGWRGKLLRCAEHHADERTPYQWGGGHVPNTWGLDCSGLVIQCAAAAGIKAPYNSDMFWKLLPQVKDAPQAGDLALYGNSSRAWHVRIVTSWDGETATVIGADGGDSTTTSRARAREQNAHVKRRDHHQSPRFLGFTTLQPLAKDRSPDPLRVAWAPSEHSPGPDIIIA
jgi:hypothetical protein